MDSLLEYFRLVLLISIPQAFAMMSFVFALWKLNGRYPVTRLVSFAIIGSLLVDIDFYYVPGELHTLTAFLIYVCLLYLFYRGLGTKNLLLIVFSYYVLIVVVELTIVFLVQAVYRVSDLKTVMQDYFIEVWTLAMPVYLLIYLASVWISRQQSPWVSRLYEYMVGLRSSPIKKVVGLFFLQGFILNILYGMWNNKQYTHTSALSNLLLFLIFALTFAAFFYTLWILVRTRDDAVRMTQDVYIGEIGKMFTSIRGQRHDFLNHVQVMHTMLQMNKVDQLRSYLADFVKEVHAARDDIHYDSPALEAFVQAKTAVALSREIRFICEIPRDLQIESAVKSVDLIKMLGNLVDNAFEESVTLPAAQREVLLQIRSGPRELEMSVHNRGRVLDAEELDRICRPGFTTKPGGTGLGLPIVLDRVQAYRGKLHIASDAENGTVFRIVLPHAADKSGNPTSGAFQ